MSRSYRKTPVFGNAHCKAGDYKKDKRIWHKRMRSHERDNLRTCQDFEGYVTTHHLEVSSIYDMCHDGRPYISKDRLEWWIKWNGWRYNKLMRK